MVLILFLIPLAMAQAETYRDYSELIINYELNTLLSLSDSSSLNYLTANLSLVPRNSDRQEIIFIDSNSNPSSEIEQENNILFTWNEYSSELRMDVISQIKTKSILHKIEGMSFPIINLNPEYEPYTEASEKIDITPEIVIKAAEIVEGETDLYTAVFKLADWTRTNIIYDLNTVTAKAALKSSWVLENREGVCDEITSLFISFARSVGIPARFISGTAYTNLDYSFGNHGWAEVYFPGHGWVPYDVTFGEYSWINPGHIALSKTLDSADPAIKYTWIANNLEVSPGGIEISAEVITEGEKVDPIFDLEVKVLKDNVGPGSYVPFKVTLENPFDEYVSDTVVITSAPTPLKLKDNPRPIMLKPNQRKSSFWIVKIPHDIEQGLIYTSTIGARDVFGSNDDDTVQFSAGNDVFTQEQALALISGLEEVEEQTYSEQVSLICETGKTYYYSFEEVDIVCEVQNIGNTLISDLEVCLNYECDNLNLNIAEKKQVNFLQSVSTQDLEIIAKNDVIELYSFLDILILEKPDLILSEFNFKNTVDYGEEFDIYFVLTSESDIENLKINIGDLDTISVEKNNRIFPLTIKTKGKSFTIGTVDLKVSYEDEYGNPFSLSESKNISVINLPWYAKISRFFKKLF